jgi:cobaltochelatase CobT
MPSEDEERGLLRTLLNKVLIPKVVGPAPEAYRVYTRDFDLTLTARGLAARYGDMSRHDYQEFKQAQALRDDGSFDPGWPDHGVAVEAAIAAGLDPAERDRTIISLLIDQSGSMRDDKIIHVALAVDALQRMLASLGIDLEVLGFTTVLWRGGQSRARWARRVKPAWPGRLNDLLHIVYLDADDAVNLDGPPAMVQMLRPSLLKENIDGEALQWAALRLKRRPTDRKLLIVISDGASVDDSTLHENPPDFLEKHLLRVIADLQSAGEIELGALGVGHSVDRYYARSLSVERPEVLASALATLVRRMLLEPDRWPSPTTDDAEASGA